MENFVSKGDNLRKSNPGRKTLGLEELHTIKGGIGIDQNRIYVPNQEHQSSAELLDMDKSVERKRSHKRRRKIRKPEKGLR